MKKRRILFTVSIFIIIAINLGGCSSMFAHLFGNDHLKDKKYKFLMFNEDKTKIMYGGFVEIKSADDVKFSGEFRIIDVFAENIPVGSGKVEGTQNEDKDKADMYFNSSLTQEKIEIKLDRTWNLLEGSWKYKTTGGKFIAFEN
jgi:hypothetical protein